MTQSRQFLQEKGNDPKLVIFADQSHGAVAVKMSESGNDHFSTFFPIRPNADRISRIMCIMGNDAFSTILAWNPDLVHRWYEVPPGSRVIL